MSVDKQTVRTYDLAAEAMAAHFQNYSDGVAHEEIDKSFEYIGNPKHARVLEIGCGAGKDAAEITKRTDWYEGFDPSEKLLGLARQHVPEASFAQADALSYIYPSDLDIVFAFASMLHLNKEDFAIVCGKVLAALRPGGIFCLTLKEADQYAESLQEDEFGVRRFFLYNLPLVRELAGDLFVQLDESHEIVGPKRKRWFAIILRKL